MKKQDRRQSRESKEDLMNRRDARVMDSTYPIMLLTHQKLRIKITKKEEDMISNKFILSFPNVAPNNRFK